MTWASVPVLCFGLSFFLGMFILGIELSVVPKWEETDAQRWDWSSWFGVMLVIICGPLVLFSLFLLWSTVFRMRSWSRHVRADVFGFSALCTLGCFILSLVYLQKPWAVLGLASDEADSFGVFLGTIIMTLCVPLTVVAVVIAHRLWSPIHDLGSAAGRQVMADDLKSPLLSNSSSSGSGSAAAASSSSDGFEMEQKGNSSPKHMTSDEVEAEEEDDEGDLSAVMARYDVYKKAEKNRGVWDNAILAGVAFGLVPAILFCCLYFPPIWTQATSTFIINGLGGYIAKVSDLAYNYQITSTINLKLFPDQIAFYMFAYFVFLVGLVTRHVPDINILFVQKRFPLIPIMFHALQPSAVQAYFQSIYTTLGELTVVSAFISLASWWFWYWHTHYLDDGNPTMRIAGLPEFERLARVMGQMSSLFMSFLVLPVSRNSVWERSLGIPFERALKYHRWLGVGFITCFLLHVLFWYTRWIQLDCFWHDIFNVNPYIVGLNDPNSPPHLDNFTMPMLFIVGLMIVTIAVCAYPYIRRKWFEVFYYTHMMSYVVFVAALIHAWALWNYLLGGLVLYYVDRLLRFQKGCTDVVVMSSTITKDQQHIRLALRISDYHYEPGQYAFLNVPQISALQWHPFSITTSPLDKNVTFFIKRMDPGSWTDALFNVVQNKMPLTVAIEGTYGRFSTLPFHNYQEVVLVAGGIGVTPLFSLYRHLFHLRQIALHEASDSPLAENKQTQIVHLHWVVQKIETLTILTEQLNNILRETHDNAFKLSLYCTRSENFEGVQGLLGSCASNFFRGRPNFDVMFTQLRATLGGRIAVLACGPEPLLDTVSELSFKHHFDYHQETFFF